MSAGAVRPEQLANQHGVSNLREIEVSREQTIDYRDVEVHSVVSVHPVERPEVVGEFRHVLRGERPAILGTDHTCTGHVDDRSIEVIRLNVYDDVSHAVSCRRVDAGQIGEVLSAHRLSAGCSLTLHPDMPDSPPKQCRTTPNVWRHRRY